jgi:arylsulfatase A-like enzyme
MRVPCVVRWPERVPAGVVRPGIASLVDLFSTCVQVAGAQLPTGHVLDGVSLDAFLEGGAESPRTSLCHFHKGRLFAIREGEWKLHMLKVEPGRKGRWKEPVACNPPELYNLARDPTESQNVYFENEKSAARLLQLAEASRAAITPGRLPPSPLRDLLPRKKKKQSPEV